MANADGMDSDPDTVVIDSGPAYNTNAWRTSDSYGPQCSQSGDFCFLCYKNRKTPIESSREDDGDGDAEEVALDDDMPDEQRDWVAQTKSVISTYVAEKLERPIIVMKVYALYNKHIRKRVKYRNFHTGEIVHRPMWTRESIDRHITHSGEWPEIYETNVDQAIHAVMDTQQQHLRDMSTGMMIPERVEQWMKTGEFLIKWKTYRAKHGKAGTGSAQKGSKGKESSRSNARNTQ